MCTPGLCLSYPGRTRALITAYRDSVTCLDDAGAYPLPLPPYAETDPQELTREEIDAGGVIRAIDVLANDTDGNVDPLTIDGFDAVTVRGGSVTLSPGTGAAATTSWSTSLR